MSAQHYKVKSMGDKGEERKLAEFVKLPEETTVTIQIIQTGLAMESVTVRFC